MEELLKQHVEYFVALLEADPKAMDAFKLYVAQKESDEAKALLVRTQARVDKTTVTLNVLKGVK